MNKSLVNQTQNIITMKMSAKLFLALLSVILLRCEGNRTELEVPPNQRRQYDYFVLSMQWPNTYCRNPGMGCRRSLPQQFTVHGLWPTRFDGTAVPCSSATVPDSVLNKYRTDLLQYWPDLTQTNFDKSKPFWQREYRLHGACCTEKFDADEYVDRVIRLAKIHNIRDYLRSKNILPNDLSYDPDKILSAVEAKTGFKADIQCTTVNRKVYLQEVRICINYNGRTVIDCRGRVLSCPKNPYYPSSVSSITSMDDEDGEVAAEILMMEEKKDHEDGEVAAEMMEEKKDREDGFSSM